MNCPFPEIKAEDREAAYIKGRMDLLYSLAGHEILSLDVFAYLEGLSGKAFKDRLMEWRDSQKME